ncbi:DUF445 domain-containing protein [Dehalobacterium formicoaceticum]|uniref:DUF445 family protein n=1 Tax=Dehalobacterium formicoaceticum TaxID=51515 RepID=A0ABT1Y7G6_9FIRM|nr:DUF445 family protein [Dehalobacterium formicoaceticum]MCR6546831.1 DUF445 family protein [Dehalobacterium formicoaceticum]
MWLQLITIPIIGALIGWITNVLAIKLIFRPYNPITIPLIHYTFQGVIPKRRDELAVSIGQVVGQEILSLDDVFDKIREEEVKEKITQSVSETIYSRLNERIPHFIPGSIKKIFLNIVEELLMKETPVLIDRFLEDLSDKIKDEVDFTKMVQEKITGYDLHELERLILMIASKELKHIEVLGGVLGFMIGLIQAVWFYLMQYI